MEDRYLDFNENVNRLINDYKKHGNLFIAFDFDNTVFDYFNVGDIYPKIESILRYLKQNNFDLILFTGNEGNKLQEIIKYCRDHGYKPTYINENPIMKTRKPYYNLLLDDRAGLKEAYEILLLTLKQLNYDYKY
jgi:hypothetical protein